MGARHRRRHVAPHAACQGHWVRMSSGTANGASQLSSWITEDGLGRQWMFVGGAWSHRTSCETPRRHRVLQSATKKGLARSLQCTESVSVEHTEVMNDVKALELFLSPLRGWPVESEGFCDNLTRRFGAFDQPCVILCPSLSLFPIFVVLNVRPEAGGKKLRSTIQRSTETGLAVEMRSRMTRQASRESTDGSMNSYSSEGK